MRNTNQNTNKIGHSSRSSSIQRSKTTADQRYFVIHKFGKFSFLSIEKKDRQIDRQAKRKKKKQTKEKRQIKKEIDSLKGEKTDGQKEKRQPTLRKKTDRQKEKT